MRSRWVDIHVEEYDYLIARVEALSAYVERLGRENLDLRKELNRLQGRLPTPPPFRGYPVPRVLVQSLPVSPEGNA